MCPQWTELHKHVAPKIMGTNVIIEFYKLLFIILWFSSINSYFVLYKLDTMLLLLLHLTLHNAIFHILEVGGFSFIQG